MSPHETIKLNVATAIANSTEIRDWCIQHFGRGLSVIVNVYGAEGHPGEKEAPFCWLYSDGANESGFVDEQTFEFVAVVGAVDPSPIPKRNVVAERTATANGLQVNGIAAEVETLREMIYQVADGCAPGAILRTVTRTEADVADYPLEWAELRFSYFEPENISADTLDDVSGGEAEQTTDERNEDNG